MKIKQNSKHNFKKHNLKFNLFISLLVILLLAFVPIAFAIGNDADGDFVDNDIDNCPLNYNPFQENSDANPDAQGVIQDGLGDACDDNMKDPVITTGNQAVDEEVTLDFTADANNGGEPIFPDTLSVTYEGNLPEGMTAKDVVAAGAQKLHTKQFIWKPTKDQGGKVYSLTLVATDGPIQDGDQARVVKKTIQITVNDTIKEVKPSEVNHAPVADFFWTPVEPEAQQNVDFTAIVADPDGDTPLALSWDFTNDGAPDVVGFSSQANIMQPHFIFPAAGDYPVTLLVADKFLSPDSKSVTVTHIVHVKEKTVQENGTKNGLEITTLQCFPTVVVGKEQVCGIKVKNLVTNKPAVGADVSLFFHPDDSLIGTCKTDINGGCSVQYIATAVGTFTVKASAELGTLYDKTFNHKFTYNVVPHAYDIINLGIFNSTQNMKLNSEDHDYFRGEGFYIKFQVVDKNDNSQLITDPNLVTSATLVSPPGGFADLQEFQNLNDGWFYFELPAIPLNHDFKGDSQVFTFAFNFKDNVGGEAKTDLAIFNNPPEINPVIPDLTLKLQDGVFQYDLAAHETDKEDSGADLSWNVAGGVQGVFTAAVVGKSLVITPIKEGTDKITLTLTDLDGDSATQDVLVTVTNGQVGPGLAVIVNADKTKGDAPLQVGFTSSVTGAVGAVTYVWNFQDGSISNDANPNHVFTKAGVYTVTLTVADQAQQTATASVVITVTEKQIQPGVVANLFINPVKGEAPLFVNVDTSGSSSGCAMTTSLDFGDGTAVVNNVIQTTHVYTTPGVYTAVLTVNAGACGTATDSVVVTVVHDGASSVSGASAKNIFDWSKLTLVSGEVYSPGDTLYVAVDFTNEGGTQLSNADATVDVPELGIHRSVKTYSVVSGDTVSKGIFTQVPYGAQAGTYDLQVTLDGYTAGQHFHRTKFRQIIVK